MHLPGDRSTDGFLRIVLVSGCTASWRRVLSCRYECFRAASITVFMKTNFRILVPAAGLFAATTSAQTTEATALDEIVVTATRTDQTLFQPDPPVAVLEGKSLLLKMEPTLGETLNREPGISSTSFGPGASRPVVRGLGGDRVRILQNGTAVLDVSNVSPDHAVAVDPLSVRSVEIVRGPATLLYGPNSIGGVVNVTDDRIPQERFDRTWPSGRFATSAGSADDLMSQSGAITWGAGPLVFHLDGFNRQTNDVDIPGYARSQALRQADPLPAGEKEARGTLPNSFADSQGAGLGASYVWDKGYLGFSYSGVNSNYGTVAEPDVTIGLDQRRWDARGAFFEPTPWVKEINFKLGYSDYQHIEYEGAEVGTKFNITGYDGRVELLHEPLGRLEGVFGFETQHSEFSALGEEAFLPPVETNANSLFFFEEIPADKLRWQFGARYDHQTNHPDVGRDRSFDAFSASAGLVYQPTDDYEFTVSAAYTQRPPNYVELYADGPHVATGTFEIGDDDLGTEDSVALDFSLRKRTGRVTGSLSGFHYRFNDFISAQPTGSEQDSLPVYAYRAIGANFTGGEIEAIWHLLAPAEIPAAKDAKSALAAARPINEQLDLSFRADYVYAEDRASGEAIPRIPPFRIGSSLDYARGPFSARLEGNYAFSQHRHADYEFATDSYFLVNASVSYDFQCGPFTSTVYLKGVNLTNEEARQSTSFLKDIAPVAGRGVVIGLQTEF